MQTAQTAVRATAARGAVTVRVRRPVAAAVGLPALAPKLRLQAAASLGNTTAFSQPQRRLAAGRRAATTTCSASAAMPAGPAPSSEGLLDTLPFTAFEGALATVRALAFYLWTVTLAVPLFVSMLLITPFQFAFDKYRRLALHIVNDLWAVVSTSLFYSVEIRGRENLPAPGDAAVYVANHQSYLDIYSLFHLRRPFKFISKTSNFLIPIIGWSMYLTGHVPLKRMDRRSQMECLNKCRELLRQSAPVLFFPEGTRSPNGKMAPFKKGAFTVAAKEKTPVIPITLDGTGRLMRNGKEGQLFPGKVIITVHKPIQPGDADAMTAEAQAAIESALHPRFHAPKGAAASE